MSNQWKSSLGRLLKGALASALAAALSYLASHVSSMVGDLVKSPAQQAGIISGLTGLILALEKFLRWKD